LFFFIRLPFLANRVACPALGRHPFLKDLSKVQTKTDYKSYTY